ncbi:MAG TPA: tRNA-binding protein [Thermoanaerobaculia bacterium]|nr:tRNA-binding protein [Thermoanaerobaculia bacterium]
MTPVPIKPAVSMEVLEKLDIRVGTIRSVEEVPESRKLVRLEVDLGDQTRTILSGMKGERKNLQELVGRQTLFVVNLEPRKMAGLTSEGMLLDLGYADGIPPALAIPERPMPDGARAG